MKISSPILRPFGRARVSNRDRVQPWTTQIPVPAPLPNIEEVQETKRESRLVFGVLALYAAVSVPMGLYLNLWIDESYSLYCTSRDLSFVFEHCRDFMLQPVAFFLLLWAWRQISGAVWFARMLPVAIVGATLWLAHRTARKWFPNLSSVWVVLPLALNPWVLFAATELRCYCLVLFCATALLYFYRDAFIAENTSRRDQVLYALTAIMAVHTYYYLVFLLAGGGVALVLGRRWRAVRDYSILMVIVVAVLVPQLLEAKAQAGTLTSDLTSLPDLARASVYVSARVFSMSVDYFVFDQRFRVFWFALIAGALAIAALTRWRDWTLQRAAIPIMTAIIFLAYLALTWKIAGETSVRRHFLVALVPLHFSIVAVIAHLGISSRRTLRTAMLALSAAGILCSAFRYAPLAKVGDYRRVARYVEANEKTNEPIVLVASHTELPFKYYYHGKNDVIPLPEHDPLERYDIPSWALTSTDEVRQKLSAIHPQQRIWVYADRPANAAFYGVNLGYEYLEQVLSEDYTVVTDESFYKARVRQFEKK